MPHLALALDHPVLALFVLLAVVRLPFLVARALVRRRRGRALARRSQLLAELSPPASSGEQRRTTLVGLFHPFCNAGGGGERVVWTAVSYMQETSPGLAYAVYTGDTPAASKEAVVERAQKHFNIALDPSSIHLVPLPSRALIGDAYWKRLTLLGQAWGAVVCAWEAIFGQEGVVPDVFIDTMGYAWAYPLVRMLGGSAMPIGAYVHYPTISPDMVHRVRHRLHTHTNVAAARSPLRSALKLVYYRVLIAAYARCLAVADSVMANSSWTRAHLETLLGAEGSEEERKRVKTVFPPCETGPLGELDVDDAKRERVVLSLAQFRPEKDHPAQLRALAELFALRPDWKPHGPEQVRLVMVGSVRDDADAARVEGLRALAKELDVADNVEFVVNASYPTLLAWLGRASVGLSTMVDEHFGINVVEFMAAGLIPLAHASAGPWLDIILPFPLPPSYTPSLSAPPPLATRTGYHALTPPDFARALAEVFALRPEERQGVRERARESVRVRFGRAAFEQGWEGVLGRLMGALPVDKSE